MSWQYNGVAKWIYIMAWCNDNIPDCYSDNGFETISFSNEAAYTWFMLRWS